MFNVEGGARDASGPLPAENRRAGNSVANSLAICLFGRRQVQVRAFQSFKVANRVRHLSRTSRSANVGRWFSVACNFLEGSGGRRNLLGTTVCSCVSVGILVVGRVATRSAAMVRAVQLGRKKRGLCCTATLENPADPGVDPYPSAWLLHALASIIVEPDAVRAIHNICCFCLPHWKGFSSRSRSVREEVLLQGSACPFVFQSGHPSRGVELNVLDSNASKGQDGSKVLQSNASVCEQHKSKREDKEAENELHVGGLRRPSQTLYLVPGWESTGRRLWDCIGTALNNDTDASRLSRLYGQSDFQSPPLELVEKVRKAIQKKFTLEPVIVPEPSFWLPSNI